MGHESAGHHHGDGHSHSHAMPTPSAQEQLWYTRTAARLTSPTDRLVVDIGCGQASMAIELARALPEPVRVIALDTDPDVLTAATAKVEGAGLTGRITMIEHDLTDGVEAVRRQLAGADLIWASSALHHVGDQQRVVTELAGLLREGGRLALAEGGLAERHLPWDVGVGEPGLELRLDAAQDRWFARMRAELPASVPMPYGWSAALRRAGLTQISTSSAFFEEPTPLAPTARDVVVSGLAQRVSKLTSGGFLDDSDQAAWSRLLDRNNPEWLGTREDLFSLTARTLYVGHRPT